ncbi:MAG: ATP-grasp domain-containing protein [Bacteroidetes bacterium]|nr:ATP-grasp domain-containing protein [Bacteroidota bacterium]
MYQKLREGGFYSIAVDGNKDAPAAKFADEFVHLNFTDKEVLLQYFSGHEVHGILPINDWGTIPAAYVSQKLGLKGISEEAAMASCDKGIMRNTWKKAGIPVPDYFVFSNLQELKNGIKITGFPCVVKPTYSGGGGRGISVLKNENDVEWAYDFAKPYVKNGRFICESFVEGTELTIESVSVNGEVHILAISDKYKPDLRTRVATSLNYPAALSEAQENLVRETVKKAVASLGIHTGMAHTEAIMKGMELKLVETGARGGGSHIFPLIIEAVSGINAPAIMAQLLTGEEPNLQNIQKRGCVYRFFNPGPGILRSVQHMDEVRQWPGVLEIGMLKKPGEEVGNLKNSFERAGHLVTSGEDRNAAWELANKAEAYIQFEVEAI